MIRNRNDIRRPVANQQALGHRFISCRPVAVLDTAIAGGGLFIRGVVETVSGGRLTTG